MYISFKASTMKHLFKMLLLSFVFPLGIAAQVQIDKDCGAIPTPDEIEFMESFPMASAEFDANDTVYIPVKYHIIRRSNGSGGLNPATVHSLTDELNTFYGPAKLKFYQCDDVNFIDNDEYFNFNQNQENEVCRDRDVYGVINAYFFNSVRASGGGSLCGYAYFPGSPRDRVVMSNACATNGSTFVHEVGHFFSLYHTHGKTNNGSTDELVDGSNCRTAGDNICDTEADPNLSGKVNNQCNYTGSDVDANGHAYKPDPKNIMSYSRKACRTVLTNGQLGRVRYSALVHRSYMQPCCSVPVVNDIEVEFAGCDTDSVGSAEVLGTQYAYGSFVYKWSTGQVDTNSIGGLPMGTYYLTVADDRGCAFIDTIEIVPTPIPEPDYNMIPAHCGEENGRLELTFYDEINLKNWSLFSTGDSLLKNVMYTSLAFGGLKPQVYFVEVVNPYGCARTDTVRIAQVEPPHFKGPEFIVRNCAVDSVFLPDSAFVMNEWITSLQLLDSTAQPMDSMRGVALKTGLYPVVIRDTSWNCIVYDTIEVVDEIKDLSAKMEVVVSNAHIVARDLAPAHVTNRSWFVNGQNLDSMEITRIYWPDTGKVELCMEVQNQCGTSRVCDSITISTFEVTATPIDTLICAGETTAIDIEILGDSMSYQQFWTTSEGASGQQLDSLEANEYFITIVDTFGTARHDTVVIRKSPPVVLDSMKIEEASLQDNSITLYLSGGALPFKYDWSTGDTSAVLSGVGPGIYSCTIIDSHHCRFDFGPFEIQSGTVSSQKWERDLVTLFPMPATDLLYIKMDAGIRDMLTGVEIYNLAGQKLTEIQSVETDKAITQLQIPVSGFSPGTYFLRLQSRIGQFMTLIFVKM